MLPLLRRSCCATSPPLRHTLLCWRALRSARGRGSCRRTAALKLRVCSVALANLPHVADRARCGLGSAAVNAGGGAVAGTTYNEGTRASRLRSAALWPARANDAPPCGATARLQHPPCRASAAPRGLPGRCLRAAVVKQHSVEQVVANCTLAPPPLHSRSVRRHGRPSRGAGAPRRAAPRRPAALRDRCGAVLGVRAAGGWPRSSRPQRVLLLGRLLGRRRL